MIKPTPIHFVIFVTLLVYPEKMHPGPSEIELLSFLYITDNDFSVSDTSMYFFVRDSTKCYFSVKDLQGKYYFDFFAEQVFDDGGWYKFNIEAIVDTAKFLGFNQDDLGFLANTQTMRFFSGTVIPLVVVPRTNAPISTYSLVLWVGYDLAWLEYKIYKSDSKTLVDKKEFKYFPKSIPIGVEIDFSGKEEGEYILIIRGRLLKRIGGPIRTYRFYHNPRIENITEVDLKWRQTKLKRI